METQKILGERGAGGGGGQKGDSLLPIWTSANCLFRALSYQITSLVVYCFLLWQEHFTFPFTFIIRQCIPRNWYNCWEKYASDEKTTFAASKEKQSISRCRVFISCVCFYFGGNAFAINCQSPAVNLHSRRELSPSSE